MKTIEIEEDLYLYIASQTKHIGESASDILRRLLEVDGQALQEVQAVNVVENTQEDNLVQGLVVEVANTETALEADEPDCDPLDYFDFNEISEVGSSTKRFLSLLSGLYAISGEQFAKACVLKGSKREYFSQDKDLLLASGKTSKPQAIPNSPYWVITNTNTARKRHILHHVASEMGLQEFQIERLCEAV
ncbi:replication initiation regulator SeqA [Agarivorans aestuarii]|uniref:Negative modulator of initiation of replication n=1 Tax=Agarivorans aestuarii TaxID=1563703 RepID=A0ABU7FYU6_9ALTE|nr:replication initiation regulator SeqA [Agarivorans aestuarii]MEE1672327.1 replication initiation regulator SeqA [Agarivorans aestuarii]